MIFSKVSIIIPVYNSEKYIIKCLDSLFEQTNYNFEVIIIDDGSTDDSNSIIKSYIEEKNPKFKLQFIEQSNNGVSASRNKGLLLSKGEYILFLDSDDFLVNDAIERINEILLARMNSEVLLFNYNKLIDGKKGSQSSSDDEKIFFEMNKKEVLKKINDSEINFWIGSTIFNKKKLLENKIFFLEDKFYGEDLELMFKYMFLCKKIIYSNIELSNYNVRENSLTTNYNMNQIDSVKLLLDLYENYNHLNNKEFNKLFYQNTISNNLIYNIQNLKPIYGFFNLVNLLIKDKEIKKYVTKLNIYNKTKLIYYLTKR